jgi:hypothetical protein
MSGIKERDDRIRLVGEVAWRCHQCAKLVEREQLIFSKDGRLLCEECNNMGGQSGS